LAASEHSLVLKLIDFREYWRRRVAWEGSNTVQNVCIGPQGGRQGEGKGTASGQRRGPLRSRMAGGFGLAVSMR
jgi:hypothetical protein